MNNEQTTKTNPEPAQESADEQTAGKEGFEIPECCRRMMGGFFCNSGKTEEEQSAEPGTDTPGLFGRLMIRMMKACCGGSTEKHSRSAQV